MKPESFDIQPMSPVEPLLPGNWLWAWMALGILFLAAIAYFLIRNRREKSHLVFLEAKAYQNLLSNIEGQLPSPDSPREHATALSLELRRYLTTAFADPLLFETTEERRRDNRKLARLPVELRQHIDKHLDTLTALQYRKDASPASLDLAKETMGIASQVHQTFLTPGV